MLYCRRHGAVNIIEYKWPDEMSIGAMAAGFTYAQTAIQDADLESAARVAVDHFIKS